MTDQNLTAAPADQTPAIFDEQAAHRIRRLWHEGRWFFSIVDVVAVLTESADPRNYWSKMKRRTQDEGFRELWTKCPQLKMRSADGKLYSTDAADTETLLRIVQSIPSPKAEPFKQWLARVGTERLQEEARPSLAVARLRVLYRKKGYTDEWIDRRIEKILVRSAVTTEWGNRGAREDTDYAVLTDTLSRGTFEVSTSEHRAIKQLPRSQNLQGSMSVMELALSSLAEATAVTLHQNRDSRGFPALERDAHEAGRVGGIARHEVETLTGQPVVSPTNYKQLRQERQRELQPPLLIESNGGVEP